jgi:hypothetical protein
MFNKVDYVKPMQCIFGGRAIVLFEGRRGVFCEWWRYEPSVNSAENAFILHVVHTNRQMREESTPRNN